jgi:hypothetical protein
VSSFALDDSGGGLSSNVPRLCVPARGAVGLVECVWSMRRPARRSCKRTLGVVSAAGRVETLIGAVGRAGEKDFCVRLRAVGGEQLVLIIVTARSGSSTVFRTKRTPPAGPGQRNWTSVPGRCQKSRLSVCGSNEPYS